MFLNRQQILIRLTALLVDDTTTRIDVSDKVGVVP